MRHKLLITLVLMMFWHSVAGAYQVMGTSQSQGLDADHLELHAHSVSHHHDDDGDVHEDNSIHSAIHMALDSANVNVALETVQYFNFGIQSPSHIANSATTFHANVLVDLLFRPPRSLA
jgi:hypothetical protein